MFKILLKNYITAIFEFKNTMQASLESVDFFIVKTVNDPWTYTGSQEGFNVLHRIIKVWKSFSWELQCYNFNITLQASTESEDFKLYKPWAHDPDTGPQGGVNDQYRNACK